MKRQLILLPLKILMKLGFCILTVIIQKLWWVVKLKIIEDLFESLLQRYQEGLKKSIKGTKFDFDSIDVLYYNLNKISLIVHSYSWMYKK